jgi:hypothetical protein
MSSSVGAALEQGHHEAAEAFRFLVVRKARQAEARAADVDELLQLRGESARWKGTM